MGRNNTKTALVSAYVESVVKERGMVTVDEIISHFSKTMCEATIYAGIKDSVKNGSLVWRPCIFLKDSVRSGGNQ